MKNTIKAAILSAGVSLSNSGVYAEPVQNISSNTINSVNNICLDDEKIANKHETLYFTQSYQRIIEAVKNTENKDIRVTETYSELPTPIGGGTYQFVIIPLKSPIKAGGKEYTSIELYYGGSIGVTFRSEFANNGSFPVIKFLHNNSLSYQTQLCLRQRYYDDVRGVDLKTNMSSGEKQDFNQNDFSLLIETALKELSKK
ncbi:hypothetical protein A9Q91_04545 [Candidatus Gracilibacteria bacterium 28_42_T64]|nr:hypothetical protein A9Q91_04545 [Candidatus Gracilibacteria bacterium 28_42_T64]